MKTAIVTWITYNNYGTLLQAYALQKKIEQFDNENVILSDREILKEYQINRVNTEKNMLVTKEGDISRTILSRLLQLVVHPGRIARSIIAHINQEKYVRPYEESQEMCEKFKRKELNIFESVTFDKLSELNKEFDVFIAGSDQVWSVFDRIFNPYYYLNFVTKKKIAYAPSLGTDKIPGKIAGEVKKLLSDYTAISVRENISSQQLAELIGRKVEWVVDPTLLHDRQFWNNFTVEIPVRNKKYLLCYFLENRKWYFDYARKLAKQLHVNIVLIPNKWEYLSNEYVIKDGVGPKEFVSWIQHAEYVLTDSYHGSIFSIIFERNFQYLLRFAYDAPDSQNIRVQSLFEFLDLNDRIVTEERVEAPKPDIDYEQISKKITEFRNRSIKYLEESLK